MKSSDVFIDVPVNFPPHFQRHGRSMSESIVSLYATTNSRRVALGDDATEAVTTSTTTAAGRGRSASISEIGSCKTTPERPPRPRYGLFESPRTKRAGIVCPTSPPRADILAEALSHVPDEAEKVFRPVTARHDSNASSVRIVPPRMAWNIQESMASSPSAMLPAIPRSRAGSAGSTTATTPMEPPPERKLSAASSSSIPFVIAMGSPHNPAIIAPVASMPPSSCSITRNAPLKISTSRVGVGGTMASCTPVTSPISPTNTSRLEPPATVPGTKPTLVASVAPGRKFSLSRKHDEQVPAPPRTPSHSRNISGSSIRTAIRLPKTRDKERDAHKMRKDSISMPQPLGSPFAVDRSVSEATAVSRHLGE